MKNRKVPRVSVVIPSYNHGRFLKQRIESVLNQTFADFEVIVIDDASTDNSCQIISGYLSDQRVKTIFRKENSGNLFMNWNLGVRKSRGEYVWIAESDDYADSRFLEIMVRQLDQNPSAGLAYCQSLKVSDEGKILGSMLDYTADLDSQRWKKSFLVNGREECGQYLIFKNTIPNASAVLFRKDLYIRSGSADESIYYGNDWMTWVSVLQISDLVFIDQPLNFYRVHGQSVREQMDLTEYEIKGAYQVLQFVLNHQDLDRDIKKKVFRLRLRSWVNVLFQAKGKINWKLNREIFNLTKRMDPRIYFRFFGELAVYPFRKGFVKLGSLVKKIQTLGHTKSS